MLSAEYSRNGVLLTTASVINYIFYLTQYHKNGFEIVQHAHNWQTRDIVRQHCEQLILLYFASYMV